jgi:hypothetical protein
MILSRVFEILNTAKKGLRFFPLLAVCCCIRISSEAKSIVVHTPPIEAQKNPFIEQIKADLAPFKEKSVSSQALFETMEAVPEGQMAAIYRINADGASIVALKNQRTAQHPVTSTMLQGFQDFVRFCKKYSFKVPEVDFVLYIDDWTTSDTLYPAPLFVFAKDKTQGEGLVVLPDFEILKGYQKIAHQALKASKQCSWKQKIEKVVWRGTTTGSPHSGFYSPANFRDFPRTKLIEISLAHPGIVDARFTKLCQGAELFASELSKYTGNFMTIQEHIPFKYQILVDGNTCAFSRAYWQLLSNCVMLKQQTNHIQWYYGGLQPYVHYIPVKEDLSDLLPQVQWAKNHDTKARRISKNATAFAKENLTREEAFKYLYHLFTEYKTLFVR